MAEREPEVAVSAIARQPAAGVQETTTGAALRVVDLRKNYGAVEAVRGLTFDVRPGEVFGLIGPDGAGKTTTFQILAGVMESTSGVADVFDRPAREMRSRTGYLTQSFSLYPDLTVLENIRYIGDLRLVPRGEIERRGLHYLRLFNMDRFTDRLAGRLSGGMRQKLSLVCALVPEPQVLLLDEPTTGVDPVSRREFWKLLSEFLSQGVTIVMATPYLDEAERCARVVFLHEGRRLALDRPDALRASCHGALFEVIASDHRRLPDVLRSVNGVIDVQMFGERAHVCVDPAMETAAEAIASHASAAGLAVTGVRPIAPSLEDVFIARLHEATT